MKQAGLKVALILLAGLVTTGSHGLETMETIVSARPGALGAGAGYASGSDGLNWNPACLALKTDSTLAMTHYDFANEFSYQQLESYLSDWLQGSWGIRLLYASSPDFYEYDQTGSIVGSMGFSDILLHAGYGRQLMKDLRAGCALKLTRASIGTYSSMGFALDGGLHYQTPWKWLSIGASVQNMGARTAFIDETDSVPIVFRSGLAVQMDLSPDHFVTGLFDVSGQMDTGVPLKASMGLEYSLYKSIMFRGGYAIKDQQHYVSIGAGALFSGIGLDYSFQPLDHFGHHHRFTLSYNFNTGHDKNKKSSKPEQVNKPLAFHVRDIQSAPRQLEGTVAFRFNSVMPDAKNWRFEVRDLQGTVIRSYKGRGTMPDFIAWDGKDKSGKLVSQEKKYNVQLVADGKVVVERRMPAFEPVVKLQSNHRTSLVQHTAIQPKHNVDLKQWELLIEEDPDKKIIKRIRGKGALKNAIIWDGKTNRNKIADGRKTYSYTFQAQFKDGAVVQYKDRIRPVQGRIEKDRDGTLKIVVPGILFDFNSAVLKPDMMDKLLVVVQAIQQEKRHFKLVCEGHSDDVGSQHYNQRLSHQRAKMVARYIQKQTGLPTHLLQTKGHGASFPVSSSKIETGRAKNRRVEILLIPLQN